jgi:hypothetical protein
MNRQGIIAHDEEEEEEEEEEEVGELGEEWESKSGIFIAGI